MTKNIAIHWFRQDLRLLDNPALLAAAKARNVLPIYILDHDNAGEHAMGGASRWWLHHSLQSLDQSLGGCLSVYMGNPLDVLIDLIDRFDVRSVHWNRCYEPWRILRDKKIKALLEEKGLRVKTCNGSLLWEPWSVLKNDGTPYKVFTPFYRKGCLQALPPRKPTDAPRASYVKDANGSLDVKQLDLLGDEKWQGKLASHWSLGERGAHDRLECFIDEGLAHYKEGRNFPAKPYVSRLSPYLHFGEISPNQVWYSIVTLGDDKHIDHFCSELGWREFAYSLLYHNPTLPKQNLQPKFDAFAWQNNAEYLQAWQQGQTGIPIVDAGMRELWQTGYMHNRVRMIVASFLVKNLRLHWHHGERWFWDTLVDADLANNSASWQWVAGCGADAAPYFRIFNPTTQGQRFDPNGDYTRAFVPEIAALPDRYLFNPYQAPEAVLKEANIVLGKTYPKPIVDLKHSREAALAAFALLKGNAS